MPVSEVRRMSKIKRGILFIVILAVFLVTSSVGMEYYVVHQLNGEVTGRNRPFAALTVEPEDTLDLLVAGDSESYNSVSTMRLWEDKGIAAYDCGQGAQRIPETYYMLKQGFKGQSPKIVMLETNTLFRDIGAVKSTQAILEQMGQYYLPVFRSRSARRWSFTCSSGTRPGSRRRSLMTARATWTSRRRTGAKTCGGRSA